MKPRPVRMPEQLWEDLQTEAEEQGLGTAEYVRKILRQRADTQANTQADTQGRLGELEQRLADLEDVVASRRRSAGAGASAAGDPAPRPTETNGESPGVRASSESAQASPESEAETEGDTSDVGDGHTVGASADSVAALDDLLREWRPGGSTDERRASARAVLEYLRDRGSATRGDLVDEVYPTDGVDSQSEDTWWRNTARGKLGEGTGGGLAIAADAGLVEREQGPPHVYRWVGYESV